MRTYLSRLTKVEKILVAFLSLVVLVTGAQIGNAYYLENSTVTPVEGGIYIEGAVGQVGNINPLYTQYGTITHDVTQLVFSGLTKYDPKAKEVVPDLASYEVSEDGKTYTFTIHESAKWHDGTSVTANDVIFTYETVIKHPTFDGQILNYNDYSGMKVAKVDDLTVEFLLEEADSFFLVKTTTGLLPEHVLGHLPIEVLEGAPFNLSPIGTGPYKFVSMTPIDTINEITLESFEDYYGEMPHIPTIQIQLYSSEEELLKKQGEVDGIRNVAAESVDQILERGSLNLIRYELPQYVAIFFNTQSTKLREDNVRLALQLGTNKEAIAQALNQNTIIDTPLLEIDQSNWVYQHSVNKANGALYETQWQLPNKEVETETEQEAEEVDQEANYINGPNAGNDWQTTDEKVTITGTVPDETKAVIVNDYELQKFVPGDEGWSYVASFEFENLEKGENLYEVFAVDFDENKTLIDSITIVQGTDEEFIKREKEEAKIENDAAEELPLRTNRAGEELTLNLIVPKSPESYGQIANMLEGEWLKLGVGLEIDILETQEFQERLFSRDYDLLIFGQNLGYNLDAYPYWHSSQAKEGGYNLSQFKNFVVDSLLDKARAERDPEDRKKTLNDIQEIISKEVPAIFLYSPTYYFAFSDTIQNTFFENLATTSDRYARISDWYGNVDRQLSEEAGPMAFVGWFIKQF